MRESLQKLIDRIHPLISFIKHYVVMIFILAFLGVYAYLIIHVNKLVQTEPTQVQLDERLKTISRTKINQAAINSILDLQDQNVEVKTLFEHARENPFNE